MNREYLGDGVYVEISNAGDIVLMLGETDDRDNFHVTSEIVLELEVYRQLQNYVVRMLVSTLPKRSDR